ncbi:MAG: tetratricopeptide repeat protein [Planctomycetota bacterium]
MIRIHRLRGGPFAAVPLLLALALVLVLAAGADRGVARAEEIPPAAGADEAARAFARGEDAREAWRWSKAADAYWKAVEADRGLYQAHVRYQEMTRQAGGDLSELAGDYDSFVEDYPQEQALQLHRLRLEAAEPRLKALKAFRKANPENDDALLEIARAQLELGQTTAAVRTLAPIVGARGHGDRYLQLLVRAEVASGHAERAWKRLAERLQGMASTALPLEGARPALRVGRLEDPAREADAVLAARPASAAAYLVKVETQVRGDQRDAAFATLAKARERTANAPSVVLAVAGLLGRGEKEDAALATATKLYQGVLALEGEAENARALYGLAWVLEQQKKFEEAEVLYRKVGRLLPLDPRVVESIGFVLFQQGKLAAAQVQFKKAIDMEPGYASAYANLGAVHDARAEYGQAIKLYEKLLRMRGQKENLRALINCAFDHEHLGAFSKAQKYLERASEIRPDDADILVWLGDNLYFQKKWKAAARIYLKAIAKDEKSFYAWRGLGYALGQQKRWTDSVDALEKAKAIRADDLELLLTLASVYYREIKDDEKALENFEAYVNGGGDDPDVPDLIEELRAEIQAKK